MLRIRIFIALATFAIVAACNGAGSQPSSALPAESRASIRNATATPTPTPTPHHHGIQYAIPAVNAMGEKIKAALDDVEMTSHRYRGTNTQGLIVACRDRVELYSPDKAGDPNSTETIDFYDAKCTQVERDRIRRFTMQGTSAEDITGKIRFYDLAGNLVSTRTETHHIKNATFDKYGYADLAAGFIRQTRARLTFAGRKDQTHSKYEFIVEPAKGGASAFCHDSMTDEEPGDPAKGELGLVDRTDPKAPSTMTSNNDGTMSYATTHEGRSYQAPHGGLKYIFGEPNVKCPIDKPAVTLTGGTVFLRYTLPIAASFDDFHLVSLAIEKATLGRGATLSASTATENGVLVIKGTIEERKALVARFEVDRLGMGTIRFAGGYTLRIVDWSVVRTPDAVS